MPTTRAGAMVAPTMRVVPRSRTPTERSGTDCLFQLVLCLLDRKQRVRIGRVFNPTRCGSAPYRPVGGSSQLKVLRQPLGSPSTHCCHNAKSLASTQCMLTH